jgi:hypothetical protein
LKKKMSISYEEALATLQSMFGESAWSRDDLDAVLRHQQGHMENTCDVILRHGDKDPQILLAQLRDGTYDPDASTRAMDEQLARQLARGEQQAVAAAAAGSAAGSSAAAAAVAPPPAPRGRGKPTTLPDDFLRIPGYEAPAGSAGGQTVMDDEALARMLQDELFSQELARNPDFAHLARGGAGGGGRPRTVGGMPTSNNQRIYPGGRSNATGQQQRPSFNLQPLQQQGEQIIGKISELGDNARRRLQLMAAQFNARNTSAGAARAAGGGAAGGEHRVAASERRGLLDSDDVDDMELAARKDL